MTFSERVPLLTPRSAFSSWGPLPINKGSRQKRKIILCREIVPSLLITVSETPLDWKVLSGRKGRLCLGSSLGKPSSWDHPRVGGGRGPNCNATTLRPAEAHTSVLFVTPAVTPACGRTISWPRPSLGPRPHPGSAPAGSGARLESTVWALTANPRRSETSLSVQLTPLVPLAQFFNLISYRCQLLSPSLGRTADVGSGRYGFRSGMEFPANPGISSLQICSLFPSHGGLVLGFTVASPLPRIVWGMQSALTKYLLTECMLVMIIPTGCCENEWVILCKRLVICYKSIIRYFPCNKAYILLPFFLFFFFKKVLFTNWLPGNTLLLLYHSPPPEQYQIILPSKSVVYTWPWYYYCSCAYLVI